MIRMTMNGLIRFGHRLSLTRFIFITLCIKRHKDYWLSRSYEQKLQACWDDLNLERKKLVLRYRDEMNFLLLRHLILRSPLPVVNSLPIYFFTVLINRLLKKTAVVFKDSIDGIDSLAYSKADLG